MVTGAAHPDAARLWLSFIHSGPALAIFERYGFKPYRPGPGGAVRSARIRPRSKAAVRGERQAWSPTAAGTLALLILLDQIPRNIFSGTAPMFASDGLALLLGRRFLRDGVGAGPEPDLLMLFTLPFTQSEVPEDQDVSVERPGRGRARDHRDITRRYGRFPHRNDCLGPRLAPEEEAFPAQRWLLRLAPPNRSGSLNDPI